MDKTAIKNFSVWARKALIRSVADKCGLVGVREDGIQEPLPQSTRDMQFFDAGTGAPASISGDEIKKREALVQAIRDKERDSDYKTAYNFIVEQVAYTWFNRLIAIRFMEVNDYLPSRIRVLSSEQAGKLEPDILATPFDAEFDFTAQERDTVIQWKDRGQKEDMDALFRLLFVKQCDTLHEILPNLFQKVDGHDYTELLLNISFTDRDGVVYHLVNDIPESNFDISQEGQVEIIGWMYQYYNTEKREEVIDPLHGKTVKKEDIPVATQLFTTDWVVRYMVDNTLGRYWIERHPESALAEKLEFFVTPKSSVIEQVNEPVTPEELKVLDPCMGSGHMLVYAFDVLVEIYQECGYTERDAVSLIVQNNLFGLDIDERAFQLAYFAVMIKARIRDRRFFDRKISPNVFAFHEGRNAAVECEGITLDAQMNEMSRYLVQTFHDAAEIGSMLTVEPRDYDGYLAYLEGCAEQGQLTWEASNWLQESQPELKALAHQAKVLSGKYPVVCTNPPYLNKLDNTLKKFVTENYKEYSGDLFSVFVYRNLMFCTQDGYCGYMTPNVWMFIKSYEKLREYILNQRGIVTLVQMAKGAFFKEATVDICTFVLQNSHKAGKGLYFRLEDFKGDMDVQKQKVLEAIGDKNCGFFYEADQYSFSKIPGHPMAYWTRGNEIAAFSNCKLLVDVANPRQGLITGDVNRFVRKWYECSCDNSNYKSTQKDKERKGKWFPYCNGGNYRKWYGNNEDVVNWFSDGIEVKGFVDEKGKQRSRPQNQQFYFCEGGTWSAISSASFSVRYFPDGYLFSNAGMAIYAIHHDLLYIIGFLNSKLCQMYLGLFNEGLNYNQGDIAKLPILESEFESDIVKTVDMLTSASKDDWDSYETSWDFKRHPLV